MTWNYRVVHRVSEGENIFAIHEAYYNREGKKAGSISKEPTWPQSDTLLALKEDFKQYQRAWKLPVLEYDDF